MDFDWSKKLVLIAEDEPANYLFLEKILKPTNVKILHAFNGSEAVETALSNNNIDLVLMDIYMPGLNGFEACNKIKTAKPYMPVIAQTCYDNQIEESRIKKSEFNDYIRKPININKLLIVMHKYLAHQIELNCPCQTF